MNFVYMYMLEFWKKKLAITAINTEIKLYAATAFFVQNLNIQALSLKK